MKYENFAIAEKIVHRIKQNEKALRTILNLPFTENNDGSSPPSTNKLYGLNLSQYSDGSGFSIDLTGSMIQMEVLKFVEQKLTEQIKLDHEQLKNL